MNKYYFLKNNGVFYDMKNNIIETENEKMKSLSNYNNYREKRNILNKKETSFSSKRKKTSNNKNKLINNKSLIVNKFNNSNYNNHKSYFINSPYKNKENSYDSKIKRSEKIRLNKYQKDKDKEKEKQKQKRKSLSKSNHKSKSRAKSHINTKENSSKYMKNIRFSWEF